MDFKQAFGDITTIRNSSKAHEILTNIMGNDDVFNVGACPRGPNPTVFFTQGEHLQM